MKVYVMTDMEGVAGIQNSADWCRPPAPESSGRYYDMGKELLTREVNAAIDGLFEGGATEVIVADGHGPGGILPLLLDERVMLMRGWPSGWPLELDESFDAVIWVGQHAKAGTPYAHIAHTRSMRYIDQSINGVSVGEFGQFALCAGELGIPAIFGSGDEAFCREAEALVPNILTVSVKRGLTPDDGRDLDMNAYWHHNRGAIHLHPKVARRAIRKGAYDALRRLAEKGSEGLVVRLKPPYERVTRFRPEKPGGVRTIDRAAHPTSISGLLNQPFHPEPEES